MIKRLKTVLFTLTAFFGLVLAPVGSALAVDVITPVCDGKNGINNSVVCKDKVADSDDVSTNPLYGPDGVLTRVINIISILLGIIAVIVIIIAAIRFMVSQGNPQTVNAARNTIIYAAVGIVVAALAQALVVFVLKRI